MRTPAALLCPALALVLATRGPAMALLPYLDAAVIAPSPPAPASLADPVSVLPPDYGPPPIPELVLAEGARSFHSTEWGGREDPWSGRPRGWSDWDDGRDRRGGWDHHGDHHGGRDDGPPGDGRFGGGDGQFDPGGSCSVPEPADLAAIVGLAAFGFVLGRRRRLGAGPRRAA